MNGGTPTTAAAPTAEPSPAPGPRRVALAAMLLVQAALFAGLSRTIALPVLVGIAAILGALPRPRARITRIRFLLTVGAVGAACLGLWRVLPHYRPWADMDPTIGSLGHALGQWALIGQAYCLFLDWGTDARGRPTLPSGLPAAGVVVLLSAGDVRATDLERNAFLAGAILFALLCGLYFSAGNAAGGLGLLSRTRGAGFEPGRWPRRAALLTVTLAVAGLTWGASVTLRRYERTMDRVVRQFLQPEPLSVSTGFGGEARLGDVRVRKQFAARSVALRCEAGAAPGYLRGRAYYTFASAAGGPAGGTRWVGPAEEARLRAAAGEPAALPRKGEPLDEGRTRFLFDFARASTAPSPGGAPPGGDGEPGDGEPGDGEPGDGEPGDGEPGDGEPGDGEPGPALGRTVEIWPAQDFRGTLFVPPNTVRLTAPEALIDADEYGLSISTAAPQPHYAATLARRGAARTAIAVAADPADPRLIQVPPLLGEDEAIREVADRVFAGSRTAAGDVAAVEAYFASNYAYQTGARIGVGGNPVRDFLIRRPSAHCEYFATAATLLLRMRGVPARYATGFVAAERNAVSGDWLARNEDAHAWCEAWDPARGWVIVEATPPAGVPDGAGGANLFGQLWDAAAATLARWRQLFRERGWLWLLGAFAGLLTTGPGLLFCGMLAGLGVWRGRRAWRTRRAEDPARRAVRDLLKRADRRLARRGLVRGPAEPLHAFAERAAAELHAAEWAEWYGGLSDLLYRPGLTPAAAEPFRASMPAARDPGRPSGPPRRVASGRSSPRAGR